MGLVRGSLPLKPCSFPPPPLTPKDLLDAAFTSEVPKTLRKPWAPARAQSTPEGYSRS